MRKAGKIYSHGKQQAEQKHSAKTGVIIKKAVDGFHANSSF
jgi:hypothetical protein